MDSRRDAAHSPEVRYKLAVTCARSGELGREIQEDLVCDVSERGARPPGGSQRSDEIRSSPFHRPRGHRLSRRLIDTIYHRLSKAGRIVHTNPGPLGTVQVSSYYPDVLLTMVHERVRGVHRQVPVTDQPRSVVPQPRRAHRSWWGPLRDFKPNFAAPRRSSDRGEDGRWVSLDDRMVFSPITGALRERDAPPAGGPLFPQGNPATERVSSPVRARTGDR